MGVTGLTDIFKLILANLTQAERDAIVKQLASYAQIRGSVIIFDSSPMFFRWNLIGGSGPDLNNARNEEERNHIIERMNAGCIRGFAKFIAEMRSNDITPIVVFDLPRDDSQLYTTISHYLDTVRARDPCSVSPIAIKVESDLTPIAESATALAPALAPVAVAPKTASEGSVTAAWVNRRAVEAPEWIRTQKIDSAMLLQAKTETREERIETRNATEEKTGKVSFSIHSPLIIAIKDLCDYLGIRAVFPLVEADWAIAALAKEYSKTRKTYVLSIDSDMLTYDLGSSELLRSVSLIGTKLRGDNLELIHPVALWSLLGLIDTESRAYLAAMLGCDYTKGVVKLGPKTAPTLFSPCDVTRRLKRAAWEDITRAASSPNHLGLNSKLVKWNLHDSCFIGMTPDQIRAIKVTPATLIHPTWLVPLTSIDKFLCESYSYKLSPDQYLQFKNAVLAMLYGPMIEDEGLRAMHFFDTPIAAIPTAPSMIVGGGSADPKLPAYIRSVRMATGKCLQSAFSDLERAGCQIDLFGIRNPMDEAEMAEAEMAEVGIKKDLEFRPGDGGDAQGAATEEADPSSTADIQSP